jgi:hypothetical protein
VQRLNDRRLTADDKWRMLTACLSSDHTKPRHATWVPITPSLAMNDAIWDIAPQQRCKGKS